VRIGLGCLGPIGYLRNVIVIFLSDSQHCSSKCLGYCVGHYVGYAGDEMSSDIREAYILRDLV